MAQSNNPSQYDVVMLKHLIDQAKSGRAGLIVITVNTAERIVKELEAKK